MSVVVGTILLIGLMVILIGIVGATVLAGDYYDPEPKASLVYDEDPDGSVGIVVEDVKHMSADDTVIRLQGQGHCTDWSGSGDIEKGDVTVTGFNDCPEKLEQGDVIQVTGNGRLIDTYELRGVYPDYGCEELKDASGDYVDPVRIENGETIACSLGEPGERIDSAVEVLNGSTLIGDVHTDESIKTTDQSTIRGTIDSTKDFDLDSETTIEGDIISPNDSVEIKSDSRVTGTVKTASKSVTLDIGNTVIEGDIESADTVDVKDSNVVHGSIIANSTVTVRADGIVHGNIDAGTNTVDLKRDVAVGGQVTAGTINCGSGATINGEDCEDYDG